jgi:hypothetical protein
MCPHRIKHAALGLLGSEDLSRGEKRTCDEQDHHSTGIRES